MEDHIMSRPHWKKKSIQRSNSVIDSSNSSNDLKFDDKSINKSETEDNDSVESEGKEATDGNEIRLKVNGKSGTRNPMCTRCANHIRTPVPVKGHKRKCPHKECRCGKCMLTVQRRDLMAKTNKLKKQKEEPKSTAKRQRSDDCASETDSGYSTHSESNDRIKCLEQNMPNIISQFDCIGYKLINEPKISLQHIEKALLSLIIKDKISSIASGKLTTDIIIDEIKTMNTIIANQYHTPPQIMTSPVAAIPKKDILGRNTSPFIRHSDLIKHPKPVNPMYGWPPFPLPTPKVPTTPLFTPWKPYDTGFNGTHGLNQHRSVQCSQSPLLKP